jgi:hypothetical protein
LGPLNAQLEETWVATYDGPAGDTDVATTLALDGLGNVYVTGTSEGIDTGYDYASVKYDAAGNALWTARYNGPRPDADWQFGSDATTAIAVGPDGGVYVTGASAYSCPGLRGCFYSEAATLKYSPDGNQVWLLRNADSGGVALGLDPAGNLYVATRSHLLKLDSSGREIWSVEHQVADLSAMAIDTAGNVHVTGGSTAKYDPTGRQLWLAHHGSGGYIGPSAIAVDRAGNVYVTATSDSGTIGSGSNFDYATVKYDAAGRELWSARYDGPGRPGNKNDYAHALVVDETGHVYVTGESIAAVFNFDYATVKYDAAGNQLWAARYSDGGIGARAIALSGDGTIRVVGSTALLEYDADGNELAAIPLSIEPQAMVLDAAGAVYVTGSKGTGSARDYATARFAGTPPARFRRGDANSDQDIDLSDAMFVLNYLFTGGNAPTCPKSADTDDSGALELTDPVYLLNQLFLGGPPPREPFQECGNDPTEDRLACPAFEPCRA